jgi:hypothetical protein
LETVCRHNWVPPDAEAHNAQKRSSITVAYDAKCSELARNRDAAIEKAKKEYADEVEKAKVEEEAKLKVVGLETVEREKKRKTFTAFFSQLKVSTISIIRAG